MAGVYNIENVRLLQDTKKVLCKHNREYAFLPANEAYREQLSYTVNEIFRPLLKDGMRILEVGAGETTTIHNLIDQLAPLDARWTGLELSWSRIAEGKRWALEHGTLGKFDTLVAASALNIPFADGAFDVVFTNGCIEQIRYGTEQAVSELLRVSKGKVVLYEPTYELGDSLQKKYIHGAQYCRGLPHILKKLGAKITRYELAPHSYNPFCCYSVMVIERDASEGLGSTPAPQHCCPRCKSPLLKVPDGLYCSTFECSSVYPVIWGIPCLRVEDALFASKYLDMVKAITAPAIPEAGDYDAVRQRVA